MKSLDKLYEIKDDILNIYRLVPNYEDIIKAKREYIESSDKDKLMYRIISREYPSWINKSMYIPYSQIENCGQIFGDRKESSFIPFGKLTKLMNSMIDVYCNCELHSSYQKIVYDDKTRKILYYLLFLSGKYKESYRRFSVDNILSLSKELYMYELLLNGNYSHVHVDSLGNVKDYFELSLDSSIQLGDINSMDEDLIDMINAKVDVTQKLVKKLNG